MASANPATMPDSSAAARSVTAYAVPDVPIEMTSSPGSRPSPRAAPMLSPVPGASTAPPAVSPTTSWGLAIRGRPGSWPSAAAATSGSHRPDAGEK